MFREDILLACGFTKESLLEASDSTVDSLKYMLELAFSQEDRIFALKYLIRINCYLAARCCITEEDRELVYLFYRFSNGDSLQSQYMAPYHRVLALYYLEQYDAAKNYIDLCFDKQSDAYKQSFYKQIVDIGFHRSKDQVYFLCHCYNGSYFFDTLLKLVTAYNWKCPISTEEQYYPDFVKMITDLLAGKYYALLYQFLFVLGENSEQAKKIILQTQGWESPNDLMAYLYRSEYQANNPKALHARISPRLLAQTQLALEFAEYTVKSSFYTNKVQSIQKLCSERPPYKPTEKRDLSRSLFLLCSQQSRTAKSFLAFKELRRNFLDPQYLLEEDFLPIYLRQLTEILTVLLESADVVSLKRISHLSIFSSQFNCPAWDDKCRQKTEQFLMQEVFTEPVRQAAKKLLADIKLHHQNLFSPLYKNTYLSFLFPDEHSEKPTDSSSMASPDTNNQATPTAIILRQGKEDSFSFRFLCDGETYIGYRIPAGTYQLQWLTEFRNAMIELYKGNGKDGMEVDPDEYPVTVKTTKNTTLVVKEGHYVTLSGGAECSLTLKNE